MSARLLGLAIATTATFLLAAPALAQSQGQEEILANVPGAGHWSFAVGTATDNRSKDASKTNGDAFVWGEAEWESADGFFYASPSFETIDSSGGSDLEIKAAVGIRPQWAGFDWNFEAAHKWQVDSNVGYDADAWEFTGDVKRAIGPVDARLRVQYSPDSTGSTEAWTWVALRGGFDLTNNLKFTAEVGRREQENSVDYAGWNAGFTYDLTRDLELELRYHDTDAGVNPDQYGSAVVAGISYAF